MYYVIQVVAGTLIMLVCLVAMFSEEIADVWAYSVQKKKIKPCECGCEEETLQ